MENKKPRGIRGKDYSTSEMLDFVIFLGSGEKTKDEIKEGLPKIFEGRHGDPIPGFIARVKQALTKEGKTGLTQRTVNLKDNKKVSYYSLSISEDEAADRLENFKGRKNTHVAPTIKTPKRVTEVEETIEKNPIVPVLKQVLEFFESPEKYTPEQVKELTEKLPDNLYDYWFDTWADLQREKFEEKLRSLRRG